MNGRERGCLQVVPCIVRRLVNMSTRARRLKTQARVLACLQVVSLYTSRLSKNNPSPKAWSGLKRIVPIISTEARMANNRNTRGQTPRNPTEARMANNRNTRGQTPRNELFAGPLRLYATANGTRTGRELDADGERGRVANWEHTGTDPAKRAFCRAFEVVRGGGRDADRTRTGRGRGTRTGGKRGGAY